jgi:hypothetical protein
VWISYWSAGRQVNAAVRTIAARNVTPVTATSYERAGGVSSRLWLFCKAMGRVIFPIIASAAAAIVAMTTGSLAHDDLGIPLDTIRTGSLSAAGFIFAALAFGSLLKRKE